MRTRRRPVPSGGRPDGNETALGVVGRGADGNETALGAVGRCTHDDGRGCTDPYRSSLHRTGFPARAAAGESGFVCAYPIRAGGPNACAPCDEIGYNAAVADTRDTDTHPLPASERKEDWFGVTVGEVIADKYVIVSRLGSGGMGAVFEARHRTIGKLVAIKILRADLATDPQQAARFLQEARAANEVTHRNIVEVLDFGSHDGRPYMVMEYLRGEALSAMLRREGPVAPSTIIRIIVPVLRALAIAHQRGVIHRDIKPENIFLAGDEDGEAPITKILDFGIAKRLVADDVRLTDTRAAFGTPAYMAPEQAMGARDVSPAADQYAIGVVLYEALSARLPHVADTYNAVIVAKVTTPPVELHKVREDLDAKLCSVIMRSLARDPADRYASVSAMREALEPFAGLNTLPPSTSPGFRMSAQSDLELGATVPAARSEPNAVAPTPGSWSVDTLSPRRRRRARFIQLGALAAAMLVGGLFALRVSRPHAHHHDPGLPKRRHRSEP